MVDWTNPVLSQKWSPYTTAIKDRDNSLAKMDFSGDSNFPTGTIRWNSTSNKFESWDGASWNDLASTYSINVDQVDGFHASATASANVLLALDSNGDLPANITGDAATLGGNSASFYRNANNINAGTLALGRGGTGSGLSDPGADRLYMWDESANSTVFAQVSNGLDFNGTTLRGPTPSGTRMLFHQTTAPTGWTKDTNLTSDTALRVTTGSVGSRTNQSSFSTVFGLTATDGHTLTTGEVPDLGSVDIRNSFGPGQIAHDALGAITITSGGGAATLDASGNNSSSTENRVNINPSGGGSHSHNMDLRVNYHDVIIASKN